MDFRKWSKIIFIQESAVLGFPMTVKSFKVGELYGFSNSVRGLM